MTGKLRQQVSIGIAHNHLQLISLELLLDCNEGGMLVITSTNNHRRQAILAQELARANMRALSYIKSWLRPEVA
jgi:hypothetical protein